MTAKAAAIKQLKRPTIELRPPSESDLHRLFEIQSDRASREMAGYPERDWEAFQSHWEKNVVGSDAITRVIVIDGEMKREIVGQISLFSRDGLREVGYLIARSHWGQGIASIALKQFLSEVAERPIHAIVLPSNARSIRILEKNGFTLAQKSDEIWTYEIISSSARSYPAASPIDRTDRK